MAAAPLVPPLIEKPIGDDDFFRVVWVQFFQKLADQADPSLPGGGAAAAASAQTAANAAKATADSVRADFNAFLATGPVWVIGDYRHTFVTLGPAWRICDGSTVLRSDYPALYNLIGVITSGGSTTSFALPNIPPVFDAANGVTPIMRTWIRAL